MNLKTAELLLPFLLFPLLNKVRHVIEITAFGVPITPFMMTLMIWGIYASRGRYFVVWFSCFAVIFLAYTCVSMGSLGHVATVRFYGALLEVASFFAYLYELVIRKRYSAQKIAVFWMVGSFIFGFIELANTPDVLYALAVGLLRDGDSSLISFGFSEVLIAGIFFSMFAAFFEGNRIWIYLSVLSSMATLTRAALPASLYALLRNANGRTVVWLLLACLFFYFIGIDLILSRVMSQLVSSDRVCTFTIGNSSFIKLDSLLQSIYSALDGEGYGFTFAYKMSTGIGCSEFSFLIITILTGGLFLFLMQINPVLFFLASLIMLTWVVSRQRLSLFGLFMLTNLTFAFVPRWSFWDQADLKTNMFDGDLFEFGLRLGDDRLFMFHVDGVLLSILFFFWLIEKGANKA